MSYEDDRKRVEFLERLEENRRQIETWPVWEQAALTGKPLCNPRKPTKLEADYAILKEFVEELASNGCGYGDSCPDFGANHGRCQACKARAALKGAT